MTREERNQYLPVLLALEKAMATSNPSPNDINTLLVLARDLSAQTKDESIPSFLSAGFGGFAVGLGGIFENMGLVETGDPIVMSDNVPYVVTTFGK